MTEELSPLRQFAEMVSRGEQYVDLAEAALMIAQSEYPALAPEPYLEQLETFAAHVRSILPARRDPLSCIKAVNQVLFEEEGFTGNRENYFDPRNSFLNEVLDRRTGIPITLSLVYIETARRAGLTFSGVGLPGHFIVRLDGEPPEGAQAPSRFWGVDPFHGGKLMGEEECRERVREIYGGRIAFVRDQLRPVSRFAFLSRMLGNLKGIYLDSGAAAKALLAVEKMILLNPGDFKEVRDRGLVRYQLKQYAMALLDLDAYLANAAEAPDREDLLELMEIIKEKLE